MTPRRNTQHAPTGATPELKALYLVTHVKMHGVDRRMLLIKELTFEADGTIRQLSENHVDPSRNTFKFRVPLCRP